MTASLPDRGIEDSTTPGDDGDWYLRSSLKDAPEKPIISPAVPVYEAFASILQEFDEVETLQRRIGNRSWMGAGGSEKIEPAADLLCPSTSDEVDLERSGVWARIKAGHAHPEPDNASTVDDYEVTSWKIQGGVPGETHRADIFFLTGDDAEAAFLEAGKFYLYEGNIIGEARTVAPRGQRARLQ